MDPMVTPRSLPKRLWNVMFRPAARYPADPRATFILALSVFSGLTALAIDAAPGSLEEILPQWGVILWGALLTVGSAITLAGMMFQTPTGIITEQIGSAVVGVTTVYYSSLVFVVLGMDAVQSVGIILAWGLSCGVRYIQLQALIKSGIVEAEHRQEIRDHE